MSVSRNASKTTTGQFVRSSAKRIAASVTTQASTKTTSSKLSVLSEELKKNTLASEIAMSQTIMSGILVEQVIADKVFADHLVQSGIIPRRTLQYAQENNMQRFTPAQSERIMRALRISGLAKEAFGDKADEWLDRPTTVFSGTTPAEMLVTEAGARAVEMFIGQLSHGFVA
jgi:putative toxin-antitoxin system antitoxin component (TIGR02293 family)